jgi:hypothetical protein
MANRILEVNRASLAPRSFQIMFLRGQPAVHLAHGFFFNASRSLSRSAWTSTASL